MQILKKITSTLDNESVELDHHFDRAKKTIKEVNDNLCVAIDEMIKDLRKPKSKRKSRTRTKQ